MQPVLLEGDALFQRAAELGVSTGSGDSYVDPSQFKSMREFQAPEHEIQRRVLEAERHQREARLWLVALVSAIASVISALLAGASAYVAWLALAKGAGS